MKGNDGSGNIPERDNWETDQVFWDKLDEQYHFGFDCCASDGNAKTELFSSDFESVGPVYKTCWMNPPFSKAREMFEHFFEVVRFGMAIYRCDNLETSIWQDIILPNAWWIFVFRGRVQYTLPSGAKQTGARFPSALVGIGVPHPVGLDGFTLARS